MCIMNNCYNNCTNKLTVHKLTVITIIIKYTMTSKASHMYRSSSLRNAQQCIKIVLNFKTALYFSALVMIGFNCSTVESCFKPKFTVKPKTSLLLNASLRIHPLTYITEVLIFWVVFQQLVLHHLSLLWQVFTTCCAFYQHQHRYSHRYP